MKTRKGIYYDLEETEYFVIKFGLIFYFSSKYYLDKFVETADKYIKEQNIRFRSKYKIFINLDLVLLISYYKQIEKRGFRIYDDINKKEITENITFINNILSY